MTDYVVTAGPLRSFEHLYDKRLDKLPDVGDFQTMELSIQDIARRAHLAAHIRNRVSEWAFLVTFFDFAALGKPIVYGLRDVEKAMGQKLRQRMEKAQEMPFAAMKYFTSDDDLVLCEIRNFRDQMQSVNDLYPPAEGNVFFYLSSAPFPHAEAYWRSAAAGSVRSKQDPFYRDFFWLATESPLLVTIDSLGTFGISFSAKVRSEEKLRRCVTVAARTAEMELNFAPGLFS